MRVRRKGISGGQGTVNNTASGDQQKWMTVFSCSLIFLPSCLPLNLGCESQHTLMVICNYSAWWRMVISRNLYILFIHFVRSAFAPLTVRFKTEPTCFGSCFDFFSKKVMYLYKFIWNYWSLEIWLHTICIQYNSAQNKCNTITDLWTKTWMETCLLISFF